MTHEQMYKAVREKVVEAVPSITKEQKLFDGFSDALQSLPCDPEEAFGELPNLSRPIRLADVLHTMREKDIGIFVTGVFLQDTNLADMQPTGVSWSLTLDDLSQQSPETIKFLFDVLCK